MGRVGVVRHAVSEGLNTGNRPRMRESARALPPETAIGNEGSPLTDREHETGRVLSLGGVQMRLRSQAGHTVMRCCRAPAHAGRTTRTDFLGCLVYGPLAATADSRDTLDARPLS